MARWTKRNATGLNAKAQACSVEYLSGYSFKVASPSGNEYSVSLNDNLSGGRCTCEWGKFAKHDEKANSLIVCGHVLAAINWCAGETGRKARAYASEAAARRQKRAMAGSSQGVWLVTRKVA